MKAKKLIWLVLVFAIAVAATVIYSAHFPKYGNSSDEIAQMATRRDWISNFIFGTDVKVYEMLDVDSWRIAVVEPMDEEDQQFAYICFKKNSSGDYEIRGEASWCPDDMMQVYRLEAEEKTFDVAVYNNKSVVLVQRNGLDGVVENLSVSSSSGITPWEVSGYGFTYKCITVDGSSLQQK